MSAVSVHHVDVPGARIHYEVRGSGPLLLVVGQPMTSGPFAAVADLLATDHTVVTYDPHGVGQSTVEDPGQPVTPEIEADDLAAVIAAVGGGPADLVGSSGGAVAGLALAVRHPGSVRTVIAHEPPVTELLADAEHIRTAVDAVEDAYRRGGSAAGWQGFVSLVMHSGPVTADGVAPATWPPSGAPDPEEVAADDGADSTADDGVDGAGDDGADGRAKSQADDELFFLRMLVPFTRWTPPIDELRAAGPRVVVAIGSATGPEIAGRSALALADRLGTTAVRFPGDHGGFMADPAGWAEAVRAVLADGADR